MRWFCVHTRPQKEARVLAHLQETLGLETYFPRLKQQRTIRRVKRVVVGPLFPRYLFCRCDLQISYRAIRYAPDVISLVTFGKKPAVVDDALIAGLKSWAGEAVDIIAVQPALRLGDRVEITDGPMRGLQAVILQERNDKDRVAVMLSILEGNLQKMFIDRSQLTRIA